MQGKRQPLFTATLPLASGCYIVRNNDLVIYVGMSKCLHNRWFHKDSRHHMHYFMEEYFPDATIEYILYPESDISERERELIKKLKPIVNHVSVGDVIRKLNLKPAIQTSTRKAKA